MLIATIFGPSSSSSVKNGSCSSIDEQKSILSKYQLFTNDNNAPEANNQRKLSHKKSQDAAKLLAAEEKKNTSANLAEEEERRKRTRMFQETAFLNDGRSSSSDFNSLFNNDKLKNDNTRHYSLNIIDDQNFDKVGRTGGTTLIPLTLNGDGRKMNNGKISDGSASIILSPITMPTIHQSNDQKCPEASWAVQIERTPSPSPPTFAANRNLNLSLSACFPGGNNNNDVAAAVAAANDRSSWTDFRYAVKSPSNNVAPSIIRSNAAAAAVAAATGGGGDFRLTPPTFRRRSRGGGGDAQEPPNPSTVNLDENQTPKFRCVVEETKNGAKDSGAGVQSLVDERFAFDQSPVISTASQNATATTMKNLPRSAPGSPNKKRSSPSSTFSPSMHRFNSSNFGADNNQITTAENENYSAFLLFGDEDDPRQKSNRRASVSSTESFSDENAARPLTRAMSTDSVDSSFSLTDYSHDTEVGQLELRFLYDSATQFLFVWVLQICDLKYVLGSADAQIWVVLFLLPFPKPLWRTQLKQNATALSFHEKFHQCVREQDLRRVALLCQLYGRKSNVSPTSDLLGQVKIRLKDVQLVRVNTIWLTIVPPAVDHTTQKIVEKSNTVPSSEKLGDLLFSLNYQPSTERLTVVISKIKCLQYTGLSGFKPKAVTVRVYLVHGAKVSRKKTSLKYITDGNVMFNESMIFALPQTQISKVSLRLSAVAFNSKLGDHVTIGQVTVGPRRTGKEFGHWQRMIEQPRTPTNMWHSLQPKRVNSDR